MANDRLNRVREAIAAAARRAGRDPAEVELVVVSKGRSNAAVRALYDAGHRVFAENRADALVARLDSVLPSDITWHFVGSVQRRKVKAIAPRIELLHSMDRERLEPAWAALADPPPVLLQVNLAGEEQKHGYARGDVLGAARRLTDLGVAVRGVMVMPPVPAVPEDSRRWFNELARLGREVHAEFPAASELSMGMSDDFAVAVECGATMVRLGRTIFGEGEASAGARGPED